MFIYVLKSIIQLIYLSFDKYYTIYLTTTFFLGEKVGPLYLTRLFPHTSAIYRTLVLTTCLRGPNPLPFDQLIVGN